MTQDEIIEMTRKLGVCELTSKPKQDIHYSLSIHEMQQFANLIAQHERNECKKLCEWKTGNQFVDEAIAVCYRAIDLRGQA